LKYLGYENKGSDVDSYNIFKQKNLSQLKSTNNSHMSYEIPLNMIIQNKYILKKRQKRQES